jgi:hypothetical protein
MNQPAENSGNSDKKEVYTKFFHKMKTNLGLTVHEVRAAIKLAGYEEPLQLNLIPSYEMVCTQHFWKKKKKRRQDWKPERPCPVPGCTGEKIAHPDRIIEWTCNEYGTMHYWFIKIAARRALMDTVSQGADTMPLRESLTEKYAKQWFDRQLAGIFANGPGPHLGDTIEP